MNAPMFVVRWIDQTVFGPFSSIEAAANWCQKHFGDNWKQDMVIHFVERPHDEEGEE